MVIVRTRERTIHYVVYCIFSTLHLVHLCVSDVEHLNGEISIILHAMFCIGIIRLLEIRS